MALPRGLVRVIKCISGFVCVYRCHFLIMLCPATITLLNSVHCWTIATCAVITGGWKRQLLWHRFIDQRKHVWRLRQWCSACKSSLFFFHRVFYGIHNTVVQGLAILSSHTTLVIRSNMARTNSKYSSRIKNTERRDRDDYLAIQSSITTWLSHQAWPHGTQETMWKERIYILHFKYTLVSS